MKYVMEFFEAWKTREYRCEAYYIRLEDNTKVYIHIPNTILVNQIKNLVDVDKLIVQFDYIGFKLQARKRLDKENFMSVNEYLLLYMYESISNDKSKVDSKSKPDAYA